MLNSLGEVLPSAARRFGDKVALVVGDRTFSFRQLDQLSSTLAAHLVQARRAPGRPRDALCAQLLGVDRQLLRRAQDRRRDQSHQRDADARRGGLRDAGLWRQGPDRQPGEDQAGARRRRLGPDRGGVRPRGDRGHDGLRGAARSAGRLRGRSGRAGCALDHRLHVGDHRASEGRHAVASRRPAQRRHDGAAAPQVRAGYGRHGAALPACLRQRRLQRGAALRPEAGAPSALRSAGGAARASRLTRPRCSRACRPCTCTCWRIRNCRGSISPR